MQKTWVQSLGWEDLLEKQMATHSSILAWRTPWTEKPGQLQSMGLQRIGHDLVTNTHTPSPFLNRCVSIRLSVSEWSWISLHSLKSWIRSWLSWKGLRVCLCWVYERCLNKTIEVLQAMNLGLVILISCVSWIITPKSLLPNFYCLSSCKQHRASVFLPLRKLFGFMNSKCWSWKNLKPK